MFFSTFKITMKRIFRSPAMLFSIPAMIIMVQQRTQNFLSAEADSFINGGYNIKVDSWYPARYFAHIELFNAMLVPLTQCIPIIMAVILALVIKDFYNPSERDVLFATNISYARYFFSKMLCVFLLSVCTYLIFGISYYIFIVPQFKFGIGTWELIKIILTKMAGMGIIGIITYMSIGVLVTALSGRAFAGSAAMVLYALIESNMIMLRHSSDNFFWNYVYFPQMKLWPSFYMNGTQWHYGIIKYYGIKDSDMLICIVVTVVLAVISFGTAYYMFSRQRLREKKGILGLFSKKRTEA